jgi:hypothetical protein
LITFGLFLKHVENTSEEVCDAYGVLCDTAEQEVGEEFEVLLVGRLRISCILT